jgi:hypothetical protein
MVAPFGSLFSLSIKRVRTCILPILLAAALVSAVSVTQTYVLPEDSTKTTDAFSNLDTILSGDEAAIDALVEQVEQEEANRPDVTPEQAGLAGILMLLSALVSGLAGLYLMIVVVEGSSQPDVALRRLPGLIIPLFAVSIWVFIVSYMWVPVLPAVGLLLWDVLQSGSPTPTAIASAFLLFCIGFVIAFIRMPRLMFAPIILILERKGVLESTRLSEQRTRGYWGKIVLNTFCFAVMMMFLTILVVMTVGVLSIPLAITGQTGVLAAAFLMMLVQFLLSAWNQAFHTELALTIFKNPRN